MAPDTDPYRTLGLDRSASLDEVKRAYRRLAKANHPDAAGEAALPRFLAIQAAYDQIAGPDARTRRPGAEGGQGGAARRPWEADPNRAGATNRAYGGRARTRPGPRPRPAGPPPGSRPGRTSRPDRPPNKATLGSTSYDGADAEPLDPDWGGASWYGTSSGTYWTLNPKEYADPRKHGPEYQARARRAGRRTVASTPPSETLAAEAEPAADPPEPPTHTTSSWWQPSSPAGGAAAHGATAGGAGGRGDTAEGAGARDAHASDAPPPQPPPQQARTVGSPPDGAADVSTEAILGAARAWLDDGRPGIGARVGRAVIGWAPVALGIGWIAGEITGCSRFSADCHPSVAPISWAIQIAVLVLLIVVTRLARVATVATIATLAAVLPASVLLLATTDPGSADTGRAALGGIMVIAWIAGIVLGAARELRRPPIERPVS
jgi:curved DNA-binding protein CbpA